MKNINLSRFRTYKCMNCSTILECACNKERCICNENQDVSKCVFYNDKKGKCGI